MSARKTPILLRRSPVTDRVMALYRYRLRRLPGGNQVIDCGDSGRQDVTADFDALVLGVLFDPDAEDIVGILDGVAAGQSLTDEERRQVRAFRERLKAMVQRHNDTVDERSAAA